MKLLNLFCSFFVFSIVLFSQDPGYKIEGGLLTKEGKQRIIILMEGDVNVSNARNFKLKHQRATFVYNKLLASANNFQSEVRTYLDKNHIAYRSYYIVNMIATTVDSEVIMELAALKSVRSIINDGRIIVPEPIFERSENTRTTEWGINKINAPDVWNLGYQGQGVVIGGQDTGYEWEHDALKGKYRGWDGMAADHDYNWHDAIHNASAGNPCGSDSAEPCDDHNHGTHTMGIMVGDDGNGNQIGVAPSAKWIACRNMDRGNGTLSTYVECFEWFMAPYPLDQTPAQGKPSKAPHVINNSWTCPTVEGCNTSNFAVLEQALTNLRNSGVVIVVSNGNNGSQCETTFTPPAIFQNSFSVGSTTSADQISSFSSRGPVVVDGSGRLKPNVVAPGSSVRSSIRNNSYASFSGTSMAGPHVAGTVALMISANPNLAGQVEKIESILEETAVYISSTATCGTLTPTDIPNNTIGYGQIDALAAVNRAVDDLYIPFIKVDQFGYPAYGTKVAILSDPQTGYNSADNYTPPSTVFVKDAFSHLPVYSGSPLSWQSGLTDTLSGDKVWWFDFSSVTTSGTYYISDNAGERSEDFQISEDCYDQALEAAFKTYYYQRCGSIKANPFAGIEYADGTCHAQDITCKFISDPTNASLFMDLSGGWHDAGDFNKYVNFMYEPVLDLLTAFEYNPEAWNDAMNIPESGNGIPDLLDEIKIETDWLLKMQDSDGGVFSLVGTLNYATASPPSTDGADRYYGPKTTSASLSAAAVLAFAARQFKKINSATAASYTVTLEAKAIAAYNWAIANPGITYNNVPDNLAAGEQEIGAYDTDMRKLSAAIFLFALTESTVYKTYIESNYDNAHMFQWSFVYPFEMAIQNSLIFYAHLPGVSSSVANDIISVYKNSVENSTANIPSITGVYDAYRAYLTENNITWGSNRNKCQKGNIYQSYFHYNLNETNDDLMRTSMDDFIHYIHGTNPIALCYLTNMVSYGADRSSNTIYHSWFEDGSGAWDDVISSTFGPPPGFIPGGPNPGWSLDGCCPSTCGNQNGDCVNLSPPSGQPALKSYRQWNNGWPQNSWSITENSISYQAAYLLLLSSRINLAPPLPLNSGAVTIKNADMEVVIQGNGLVMASPDNSLFRININNSGVLSSSSVTGSDNNSSVLMNSSMFIEDRTKGLLVKSPDNTIWRIRVDNSGTLYAESIGSSPAIVSRQNLGDIHIFDSGHSIILRDEDGHCFKLDINNLGELFSKATSCP